MTLSELAARLTGEAVMSKDTGSRERPTRDEIARLAYHFYELRNRQNGRDLDDWHAAEAQLAHHYR